MYRILLFLLLIPLAFQAPASLEFTRPTLAAHGINAPSEKLVKIYEDKNYLFYSRDFGKKGEQVPGLFVESVERKQWLEITKLSTENARLGRSSLPQSKKVTVSWDYTDLVKQFYADIPLRTSASINLPDRMVLDEGNNAYRLDFNSSINTEESLTSFWIKLDDLAEAFDEASD
jgi:hypothetical protein